MRVCAYHSRLHFVDGVEVEFLFAAVDALDHVVGLGVIVQHHQASQLTMQMLAQAVTHPCNEYTQHSHEYSSSPCRCCLRR